MHSMTGTDRYVIHQITAQRERFLKNVSMYIILEQFGKNVVTTEGQEWRMHRRIVKISFNEKNSALVWRESIAQAQGMVEQWVSQTNRQQLRGVKPQQPGYIEDGKNGSERRMYDPKTITSVNSDTMKLALHIISYVGFGLTMLWPAHLFKRPMDARDEKYTSETPRGSHTMTLIESLQNLLEYLFIVLITPNWMMKYMPIKAFKVAGEAKANYQQYMDEMVDERLDDIQNNVQRDEVQGMDLVGHLARKYKEEEQNSMEKKKQKPMANHKTLHFDRSNILGNIFIMMVAGHETTANLLHFMLLYLAAHPSAQRSLVRDLDGIIGSKSPENWDYDTMLVPLLNSYAGACMNEVLRIMPSVTMIPKIVTPDASQTLTLDGTTHVVPPGTQILMSAFSAARNPKFWPTQPSRATGQPHDMDDFLPERWFRPSLKEENDIEEVKDDDLKDDIVDNKAAGMYQPVPGSYFPFSEGARSCLGRRIAQVEMMATLAVIFQHYSVELAVDEWATDIQVDMMDHDARRSVYKKAQDKFEDTMTQCISIITLKLHGSHVPIRFVERGNERFVNFLADEEKE
ncbi:Sterol 26-hydroxylase mitochondrial [Ceratocystis lukuohia]|uniref:Sterol 26-hydroxylase mitochondrial n=1 Tax=Ceratocystis lukuohia TaxID=2019550 RepID=A0ABR4MU30_9PEZI